MASKANQPIFVSGLFKSLFSLQTIRIHAGTPMGAGEMTEVACLPGDYPGRPGGVNPEDVHGVRMDGILYETVCELQSETRQLLYEDTGC